MEKLKILVVEDSADRMAFFKKLYKYQMIDGTDNSNVAIKKLSMDNYDIIHLDYDLGDHKTSIPVARFIKDSVAGSLVVIHSDNPDGALKLKEIIPTAMVIPISKFNSDKSFFSRAKSILSIPAKYQLGKFIDLLDPR